MESSWHEAIRRRVEEATERYQSYSAYELRNALENAILRTRDNRLHIEERVLLDVVHQRMRKYSREVNSES